MRFEWDDDKNQTNQRKHHLSFETAKDVFLDPHHLSVPDRVEDGEQRWQTIGLVAGVLLIIVGHTYREDAAEEVVRIITARKATRKERRNYENG
jgi:uncharacterized protein